MSSPSGVRRRGTATCLVSVVAALATAACDSPSPAPDAASEGDTTPSAIAVAPAAPTVDGPLPLRAIGGITVITPLECRPAPARHRACSVEGDTYLTSGRSRPVTLQAARTTLGDGATSWTAELTFRAEDERDLAAAAEAARGLGGHLLLSRPDRRVVLELPVTAVDGPRVTLGHLDKPEAWAMVEALGATPPAP